MIFFIDRNNRDIFFQFFLGWFIIILILIIIVMLCRTSEECYRGEQKYIYNTFLT